MYVIGGQQIDWFVWRIHLIAALRELCGYFFPFYFSMIAGIGSEVIPITIRLPDKLSDCDC